MELEQYNRAAMVAALGRAVPAGKDELTAEDVAALAQPTGELLAMAGAAERDEYLRFQELTTRGLCLDQAALRRSHTGKTVLVTGGTGCIGSTLLAELAVLAPASLVSLSRGVTPPWSVVAGVDYRYCDIRDQARLDELFAAVRPDIVYHLAAQHDPGLAEIEVARTLSTNITGSANVMLACRRFGTTMIHASTGKALRPWSRDVYAASKKVTEWMLAYQMRTGGLVAAAARFTHVVDNSIIADRLREWTDTGAPVRLHSPHVSFYLQSAREAAHLLMCVGLEATSVGLRVGAIRDLGWPISLMDLAVGWLSSIVDPPPLYLCGFEAGYEVAPYPALYDPRFSGDLSPLFNALEAPAIVDATNSGDVDVCTVGIHHDARTNAFLEDLSTSATAEDHPVLLRAKIEQCGWVMLTSAVESLPTPVLERHVKLARQIPDSRFSRDDRKIVMTVDCELLRRSHDDQTLPESAPRWVDTREPALDEMSA